MNSTLSRLLAFAPVAKIKQKISYPPVPASDGEGTHLFLQALTANTWRIFFLLSFSVIGCILIDLYLYFNDTYLYIYNGHEIPYYENLEDYKGRGETLVEILFVRATALFIAHRIHELNFVCLVLYIISVPIYYVMIALLQRKYKSVPSLQVETAGYIWKFCGLWFVWAIIWSIVALYLYFFFKPISHLFGAGLILMRIPLGMLTAAGLLLRAARAIKEEEEYVAIYKKIFMSLAMIYWLVPAVILFLFSLYRLAV